MATTVHRRSLGLVAGVAEAFDALYRDSNPALWLESNGERGSGRSVLATGHPTVLDTGRELDHLRELWRTSADVLAVPPGVPLGLVGWLSYDIAEETLGIPGIRSGSGMSSSKVVSVTRSLEIDQRTLEVTAWGVGDEDEFEQWCEATRTILDSPGQPVEAVTPGAPQATWRDTPERYRDMITDALEAIRQGEVYQLCLTTEVVVPTEMTDVEIHLALRDSSPTQHQGLLRIGDVSVISASPETFLSVDASGQVTTRPIKGTRPRGDTPELDRQLASELVESEKERAENLMIVDLMRNDLQRVCETGSVQVAGLFELETYSSVHQLVSTVTGQLSPAVDGVDLLRACFPAGSMTGAPKHRAVTLLREIESGARGVYSGAWGWWRLDGSMDWAMTIRTAIWQPGSVSIGVGGGITWSSVLDHEIAEVGHKARKILQVLGVTGIQYS